MSATDDSIKKKNAEALETLAELIEKSSISKFAISNPVTRSLFSVNLDDSDMYSAFETVELNYDVDGYGMLSLFTPDAWSAISTYGVPLKGAKIVFGFDKEEVEFMLLGNNQEEESELLESIAEAIEEWMNMTIKYDKIEYYF